MANPWDSDEIIGGNPWDADPVVSAGVAKRADFSGVQSRVRTTEGVISPDEQKLRRVARARAEGQGEEYRARLEADRMRMDRGIGGQALIGAGGMLSDIGTGLGQLVTSGVRKQLEVPTRALNMLGATDVASRYEAGVVAPIRRAEDRQQQRVASERIAAEPLRGSPAAQAGGILAGGLATAGPGVAARGTAAGAALLPTTVRGNALAGAAYGAAMPVASEGERAGNIAATAALSSALPAALAGARRLSGVTPDRAALASRAESLGIPLHAAQLSESTPLKVAASSAKYLPFSGARAAANRQQAGFNRALSKTIGQDSEALSDEVVRAARQGIGQQFEDVYSRNAVPLGPEQLRRLTSVETDVGKRLTRDQFQIVRNQMDDILQEAQETGVISGKKYQALRTQIMKAEGPDNVGSAVSQLRKEFDKIAAESVGQEDAATLARVRSQWANLRTIEGLLKQVSGAGGDIKPSAVWPAIRKGSTKEMREIGRIGQVLLKDPIPDSGTAPRNLYLGLLGGGGVASGGAAIPSLIGLGVGGATVGRALNSNLLAKALTKSARDLTKREKNALAAYGASIRTQQQSDQ